MVHTSRIRSVSMRLLLLLCVTMLVAAGSSLETPRAHAASDGVMKDYGGWTVGTRQVDTGEFTYCIEPGAITPSGPQHGATEVDALRAYSFFTYDATGWSGTTESAGVSGAPLSHINYVLTRYGATRDREIAVAVQFAIWLLRESPGEQAWLTHHLAWVEAHGGEAEIAHARELVVEARRAVTGQHETPDPGSLSLTVSSEEQGSTGTVTYPAGTTELRIQGGTFPDGSSIFAPAASGGIAEWGVMNPHAENWIPESTVQIDGDWTASGETWPAKLSIYASIDPDQQTLAWMVGPVAQEHRGSYAAVSTPLSHRFEPVLSTRVLNARPGAGEALTDVVTLGASDASGPWPSRRSAVGMISWLPIQLEGVIYGPFDDAQEIREEVPTDAPVFERVTLIADQGPGDYRVEAVERPSRSGYYYWVWSISASGQPEAAQAAMLPEGYRFSDAFGLPEESHLVTVPVPPVNTPEVSGARTLVETGGSDVGPAALAFGVLSLGAGSLLVLLAGIRRVRDLQHPSSGVRCNP